MGRTKFILAVASGIVSVFAFGCFFALGQRPYLIILAFVGLLVTLVLYAYSAPGGDTVAEDLRRADETPVKDASEEPFPPGS
jgi:hypothetical protein